MREQRNSILDTEVTYIPGVGPKRAELLGKELRIFTYRDLLYFFPYKYIDKSRFYAVSELDPSMPYIQLRGIIESYQSEGGGQGKRIIANFRDATGIIRLVWFKGHKWLTTTYPVGQEYIVFGKPTIFSGRINIIHPEIEEAEKWEKMPSAGLQGVYSVTERLKKSFITSRTISKLVATVLKMPGLSLPETLPSSIITKYKLMNLEEAIRTIHFPAGNDILERSRYRIKFEELFYIQLNIVKQGRERKEKNEGPRFVKVGDKFNGFYNNNLKFELTNAQKRVIKEIRKDCATGKQMNRLLQGDVGSGKTLVALMSMLIAADNGYQSCLMVPTEILANQHYNTIRLILEGVGIKAALLTGSTRKKEREVLAQELESGEISILIGTHALLEEYVRFSNLGFVVIDEQHRFGVAQRGRMWEKGDIHPHVLVMTATPIPRTLAMTVYGDLDVSVIDELPPGRKPVKTIHITSNKKPELFTFLFKQIKEGRQVYIVYPLIQESESLDYLALENGYEEMLEAFPPPKFNIAVVHGKLPVKEKDAGMELFKSGKAQIMVATTVIEVGVDIPNATVMVIENAERFGLSQLHQLRGRVGRGGDQSYCVLVSSYKLSSDASQRLEIMVRTNDGFEIAEADMHLRGPGDIEGTQQSGMPFELKMANLVRDTQLLAYVRDVAEGILAEDPGLSKTQSAILRNELLRLFGKEISWSNIS